MSRSLTIEKSPAWMLAACLTCILHSAPASAQFSENPLVLLTWNTAGGALGSGIDSLLPFLPYTLLVLVALMIGCSALIRRSAPPYTSRASQTMYARPAAFIAIWPKSPGQSDWVRARR